MQVLADRMNELLDEVASRAETVIPPDADVDDLEPLTAPVDEEFRVAAMGLAWDGAAEAVVVEAVAAGEEPIDEEAILSDSEEGPDALRVTITPDGGARLHRPGPPGRSPPGGPPARSARCRWTRPGTCAPGRTATAADPRRSAHERALRRPRRGLRAAPRATRRRCRLLRDGEIDLEGRLLDASNVTLFGTIRSGGVRGRLRLQAGGGGAAAVGLPRRHAGRAGRSRPTSCRRRPAGTSSRPRCCGTGPFGPGMVQLWIDGDEDVDLPAFVRRDDAGAAPDGGLRRRGEQRRPQGRPHHPDAGRPRVRRRPRRLLLHRPEAAHAAVALGGQAVAGRRGRRCWSAWPTNCAASSASSCTST